VGADREPERGLHADHSRPGQTGTITLTFAPTAPKGTVVRGFIGVDTFNCYTVCGDELVNIPCSYTVG
jgi:hypothetical protein